jgi:hypothetical protein
MFKNFNWKTFFLTVLTALLAGIGVDQSGILDSEATAYPQAVAMAAPLSPDLYAMADAGTDCKPYCAIYEVTAFWKQPIGIGGGATPGYNFTVLTPYRLAVLITGNYEDGKAVAALEKIAPYPGWKVDKIAYKKFVQWIKYPSSSGDKPEPEPKEPPVTE